MARALGPALETEKIGSNSILTWTRWARKKHNSGSELKLKFNNAKNKLIYLSTYMYLFLREMKGFFIVILIPFVYESMLY